MGEIARVRAPGVKLEHADLDETHEAGEILDHDMLSRPAGLGHGDPGEARWHAWGRVLLVEAAPLPSLGTADQRQRPACNLGQHPLRNRLVVGRELALGDALAWIEHPVRVREPDTSDLDRLVRSVAPAPLCARPRHRRLPSPALCAGTYQAWRRFALPCREIRVEQAQSSRLVCSGTSGRCHDNGQG
jgi:hypothetical protein